MKFYQILLVFAISHLSALTPCDSFEQLVRGNERFINQKSTQENTSTALRNSQKESQSPFAIIVACADSRVAPEIIFDQDIGSLFVVRVAGNVIGPLELESIEYAAKYLGSSCILVMGHQNCGAVNATIENKTMDIPFIGQLIKPSVIKARQVNPANFLKTATEINAKTMANFLNQSQIISSLKSQGKIAIKAAYYNFSTGTVEML